MSTPNINKLEKLEKELTRFFSYNKRLDSDDLSDDARFIRAWFLRINRNIPYDTNTRSCAIS
jgi:hypothetical protein